MTTPFELEMATPTVGVRRLLELHCTRVTVETLISGHQYAFCPVSQGCSYRYMYRGLFQLEAWKVSFIIYVSLMSSVVSDNRGLYAYADPKVTRAL